MQGEKRVSTNRVDPVIDQKVVKNRRMKWLAWLLLLLAIILFFIWYMQHQHRDMRAVPESQTIERNTSTAVDSREQNDATGNAADKINAWFASDKSQDSEWITLDSISFNSGSAKLVMDGSGQLEKIADLLNTHSEGKVIIRGFADSTGSQALNNTLSEERAKAVKEWLIAHDVKAERFSVDGRGMSAPVASNATEQGREMNRRVALKIVSGQAGK